MDCRHVGPLGARWDYLTHDDTSGTGWIVCRECNALLERVTVAGGRFRGAGRYVSAFQDQIANEAHAVDLRDLEVD